MTDLAKQKYLLLDVDDSIDLTGWDQHSEMGFYSTNMSEQRLKGNAATMQRRNQD